MNEKIRILVVDDEHSVREMISILLHREGYNVVTASNGNHATKLLESGERYDLVITDLAMDRGDGLEVLSQVKSRDKNCPVILVTAFGSATSAVEAMKQGAHDYIAKPFNIDEFKHIVKKALKHRTLIQENINLRTQIRGENRLKNIVGHSEAIKNIIKLCQKVADGNSSILITGESGTGKELIAKGIHFSGEKSKQPFIAINCGALPPQLMESELFGHLKGSFTDATSDKEGLIRAANRGTLFLDEIGELPQPLQVKLLRVLQEKTIRPVGGSKELPVNVRVISATNQNLENLLTNNLFRKDLYYRLNVISIEIPPLRERREDIMVLINDILPKLSKDIGRSIQGIRQDALKILLEYDYPGNVRELKNILERSITLASGNLIELSDLPLNQLQKHQLQKNTPDKNIFPKDGIDLDSEISKFENNYINQALARTGGIQAAAAQILGITVRSLRYRLKKPNLLQETNDSDTKGHI